MLPCGRSLSMLRLPCIQSTTYLAGHSWSTASKSVDNHSGAGFILQYGLGAISPRCSSLFVIIIITTRSGIQKTRQRVFWNCRWFSININQISNRSEPLNSLWSKRWDFHVEGHLQHVMSKRSVDQGHDPEHIQYSICP